MSAEVLRQAAAAIRDSVDDLPSQARWDVAWADHSAYRTIFPADSDSAVATMRSDHAAYFASWHPAVALAVADWLDYMSKAHEDSSLKGSHALVVARAYLGGDQ